MGYHRNQGPAAPLWNRIADSTSPHSWGFSKRRNAAFTDLHSMTIPAAYFLKMHKPEIFSLQTGDRVLGRGANKSGSNFYYVRTNSFWAEQFPWSKIKENTGVKQKETPQVASHNSIC